MATQNSELSARCRARIQLGVDALSMAIYHLEDVPSQKLNALQLGAILDFIKASTGENGEGK